MKKFQDFDQIHSLCEKFGIENYSITYDGLVDVDGDVNLSELELVELPLHFGKVEGSFNCQENKLVSLQGSPKEVGDDFLCFDNELKTLVGGPFLVGGDFNCRGNQIVNLEGSPNQVNGCFYCGDNPYLISLNGIRQCRWFGPHNTSVINLPTPVNEIWNLFKKDLKFLDIFELYNLFQIPGVLDADAVEEIAEHLGQKLPENWTLTLNKYRVL